MAFFVAKAAIIKLAEMALQRGLSSQITVVWLPRADHRTGICS
jgi:hypothetical protein